MSNLVIGKASKYYTLWEVSEVYEVNEGDQIVEKKDFLYLQNLSHNLEDAKEKVLKRVSEYKMDFNLRGSSSFSKAISSRENPEMVIGDDCFKFGKRKGDKFKVFLRNVNKLVEAIKFYEGFEKDVQTDRMIADAKGELRKIACLDSRMLKKYFPDVSYTLWYYTETKSEVLGAFLKEACLLVDRGGELMTLDGADSYDRDKIIADLKTGHHFSEGDRVNLTVKMVEEFSFDGRFGRCYVRTYASKNGMMFKYMGSNPPDITGDFCDISAGIKHADYNGESETRLQRIKIAA